jgi:Tfp pilus assembly protein PilW
MRISGKGTTLVELMIAVITVVVIAGIAIIFVRGDFGTHIGKAVVQEWDI